METKFQSPPVMSAAEFDPRRLPSHAAVFRALAAHWPAVRQWSFETLAHRVPDVRIQLVEGNREAAATRFREGRLRDYLLRLHRSADGAAGTPCLKEFDLLAALPSLRTDLRHHELLARTAVRSLRTWIGPAGARTGLHFDHLDNIAVQVIGTKRWRLARPGTVQRLGAVSSKYDAWAILAGADIETLARRAGSNTEFFECELHPSDVLYVPGGWWHEVCNLSASLLFGGFHGSLARVLPRWLQVTARHGLHRAGWVCAGHCTCHPAR